MALLVDGRFLDALTSSGSWGRGRGKKIKYIFWVFFFLMTAFDLSQKRKNLLGYFIPAEEMDSCFCSGGQLSFPHYSNVSTHLLD